MGRAHGQSSGNALVGVANTRAVVVNFGKSGDAVVEVEGDYPLADVDDIVLQDVAPAQVINPSAPSAGVAPDAVPDVAPAQSAPPTAAAAAPTPDWRAAQMEGAMARLRRHGLDEVSPAVHRYANAMVEQPEEVPGILAYLHERQGRANDRELRALERAMAEASPLQRQRYLDAFSRGEEVGKRAWWAGQPPADRLVYELDRTQHDALRNLHAPMPRWAGGTGPGLFGLGGQHSSGVFGFAPPWQGAGASASGNAHASRFSPELDFLFADLFEGLNSDLAGERADAMRSIHEVMGLFGAFDELLVRSGV